MEGCLLVHVAADRLPASLDPAVNQIQRHAKPLEDVVPFWVSQDVLSPHLGSYDTKGLVGDKEGHL